MLPKSIRPIDVTKALYQLQLLPDRRDEEPSALEPAVPLSAREAARRRRRSVQPAMEALLKEHDLELRKFVVSTLDTWTHRIVAELRPRVSPVDADDEEALASPPLPPSRPWRWVLATFASLAALVFVGIPLLAGAGHG